MKYLVLSLLMIIFSSCAKGSNRFELDPALSPYYEQFVQDVSVRGDSVATNNLIMVFGDLGDGVSGQCGAAQYSKKEGSSD